MNRPGITDVGMVTDVGTTMRAFGWGIGLCIRRCTCHLSPTLGGGLALLQDPVRGFLGLVSYRPECDCCQPWRVQELHGFLRALEAVDTVTIDDLCAEGES